MDGRELTGGLLPVINFRRELTPQGKAYFQDSLQVLYARTQEALYKKVSGLSNEQIEALKYQEMNAVLNEQSVEHNLEFGQILLTQSLYDADYISKTLSYLSTNTEANDLELYRLLCADRKFLQSADATPKVVMPVYTEDEAREIDFQNQAAEKSLTTIYKLFRLSQYDIMTPVEKELFINEFKSDFTMGIETIDNSEEYEEEFFDNDNELEESILDGEYLEDAIPDYMRSFLIVYHLLPTQNVDIANGMNFVFAQEVREAFEFVQIVLHASFECEQDAKVSVLQSEQNINRYQKGVPFEIYKDYYEENKDDAFIALEDPCEWEGNEDKFLYGYNFAHKIYYGEFYEENRKSYDFLLQTLLDEAAEVTRLPTVRVADIRKNIALYDEPRI